MWRRGGGGEDKQQDRTEKKERQINQTEGKIDKGTREMDCMYLARKAKLK
jgi:hypothetical protein